MACASCGGGKAFTNTPVNRAPVQSTDNIVLNYRTNNNNAAGQPNTTAPNSPVATQQPARTTV